MDKMRTTISKPSTNAAIERYRRTLNSMLAKVVYERQTDWDFCLPYAMAAFRSTKHDSASYSPKCILFGGEVRAPVDLVLGTGEAPGDQQNYDVFVEAVRARYSEAYALVREHLNEAAK